MYSKELLARLRNEIPISIVIGLTFNTPFVGKFRIFDSR